MRQRNSRQQAAWLRAVGLVLLLLLPFGRATADNNENTALYMVTMAGLDQLKIQMPVYDEEGYDGWIDNGYIYVTPAGGSRQTLLRYYCVEKYGARPTVYFFKDVGGEMTLKRDQGYSDVTITASEKSCELPCVPNKEYFMMYITWTVPDNLRGKALTISWSIHKKGNGPTGPAGESTTDISINPTTWTLTAIPELIRPSVMDPILGYDAAHAGQTMLIYSMGTNNITNLEASYTEVDGWTETKKKMYIDPEMSGFIYLDASKCYKDFCLKARYIDTEKKARFSQSDMRVIPTLHLASNLNATLREDGTVAISWTCRNNHWNDISTGDSWEVQRNTTGALNATAVWQSIAQVAFVNTDTVYTCTDQTLIENYEGQPVYYRVRRASTAAWDWKAGTYAMTMLPYALRLPALNKATVSRGRWDENTHEANFLFAFGNAQYDSQGRFVLRTLKDWELLASMVNTGTSCPDVIMAGDIDLGTSQTTLGTSAHRYHGTFDGNGHTLTVHLKNTATQYTAPFAYVGGGKLTVKNLTVAGTVYTTQKFASGLVGNANSDTDIAGCRVSVALTSDMTGDASSGGFIAHQPAGSATLTNCLFDGELLGSKAHSFGGFIGWVEDYAKADNCLFAPRRIDIDPKFTACQNFIRYRNYSTYKNSYFTIPIDGTVETYTEWIILRNTDDWNKFCDRIANGEEVKGIMVNDFTITRMAGTEAKPFTGSFNGNGRTLTVNLKGNGAFTAPFAYAKDTYIVGVNVDGTITNGGMHSGGLVGSALGSRNVIDMCRVSVDIQLVEGANYAGGIMGHAHSTAGQIHNCLFDGTITAASHSSTSYVGAIMGWADNTTVDICSCLENGEYKNFEHAGMNYKSGTAQGGRYSFTTHEWGECPQVGNRTPEQLMKEMGGTWWKAYGKLAVPYCNVDETGQGSPLPAGTLQEQLAKMTEGAGAGQWEISGSGLAPIVASSTEGEHATTFWDKQARLVLEIDKSVGGKVRYTERRSLTSDECKVGALTHELTTSCVDHDFRFIVEQGTSKLPPSTTAGFDVAKTETGEMARYEYNNNVTIDTLYATAQQSSVALTWKVTGTGDFFRITRRDMATGKEVELESAYTLNTYIDKTPQPQHEYEYTVEGVNQCEGEHVSTATTKGWCESTGMVRGYVRLADGTAMAGVKVTATPVGKTVGEEKSDTTDERGFYEIKGLKYNGEGHYTVTAATSGEEGDFSAYTATFDEWTNLVTNANLVMQAYYLLTGSVMYEGTSVPVVGAQFERDGEVVHNGSGKPVVTDSQGRFRVSLPQGPHTLRVVKDGHVFADDGYYLDTRADNPQRPSWQKSIYDYVFWDRTRVALQGRVVGGDVQGSKPLGQLASVNNLGDSLTIVMQLEGDNASYLVRDQLNASITERHTDHRFGTNQLDSCHMDTYRHRLVIKPNPQTGEYSVPMLPVKYKVTEIYAEGYSTLFQAGKVGETLDLSAYANGDTAIYSRIYHSTPTLAVRQFNLMGEEFMGIKSYTDMDNTGKNVSIELWNDTTGYSLGHPVFMAGSPVIMLLSAVEQYYKNNNPKVSAPDIVHLTGGEVRINNALVGTDNAQTVVLDSLGEGTYRFTPENLTFTEENDLALKTMSMTLLYDSTFYDVLPMEGKPIQGYVMAAKAKSQGRRVVEEGSAVLVDILRDPPGAGSSAYIESGTKLNYSFTQNVKAQAGVKLTFGKSSGDMNMWSGVWAGVGSGTVIGRNEVNVSGKDYLSFGVVFTYYNSWQYGYTFETTERISTSSSALNVGRDADVFIGMTQSHVMEDGIAVRVIDEDTYNLLTTHAGGTYSVNGVDFKVAQGTMKVLAQGKDSGGRKVYLVRDEVLTFKTELLSTFVHSAIYIEKELIPELFNLRNALILPQGTSEQTAQQVAKQRGCAMYISKVPIEDEHFGQEEYYTQVNPEEATYADSVAVLNRRIRTWLGFLATNEREKLEANDLVKRYEVDGRSSITYGETFGTSDSQSRYFQIPLVGSAFGNVSFGPGMTGVAGGGKATGITSEEYVNEGNNSKELDFKLFSTGVYLKITPVVSFDYNYNYGKSEGTTKKVGFTLAPSTKSNLIVDVYRTKIDQYDIGARVDSLVAMGMDKDKAQDLFFQYVTDDYLGYVRSGEATYGKVGSLGGLCSYVSGIPTQYRSLVYRTRGGATNQPYEGERRTKYYAAGQVLDEKTIEIDRLRIWAEQASVSNVPYDEPARFTIHMANESEMPQQCTEVFTYMLSDIDNAKGAKITIDGNPLAGEGHSVFIPTGQVVTKQVEIYPGADFDYDNLVIQLFDPNDKKRVYSCNLSAHFVPTAGKVNISLPGDKWVVNTESQYDAQRQQYYMPVRIDGFDVNYRNFDHIELQYKLTTQGDKEWVNICSYYKDSLLMAKATGECRLIEDDGRIIATFWGESDPVEQTYDLRAVNYCRYGSGFLTRSSNILTGVKDTRRPQLFGTPKPEDGILGVGGDILLRFSENIAGNYLRELNNFQVLGQTNSSNIALSTDLRMEQDGYAVSMGERNLSAKSFTVEMMLLPDKNKKEMVFFSHGSGDEILELGLTPDCHLTATFYLLENDTVRSTKFTSAKSVEFNALHQVSVVFKSDIEKRTTTVSFFDGNNNIGNSTYPRLYSGQGTYRLASSVMDDRGYEGEMLEFRLWNRALTTDEIREYKQKRLTGYELGLLDNFPLNEGQGNYSYNRVSSGGDMVIAQGTWKVPDGISMRLDGQKGFRIDPQQFNRQDYHDYTLSFWFNTTDSVGTLLSNGRAKDEAGASDHFNFGVRAGALELQLGGMEILTGTAVNDAKWHHVALSVCRSRNVGNLYLDSQLRRTFAVDTLGGILGNYLAAGATYLGPNSIEMPIKGHIDEIAMYEMALSENIIKASATMTPTGEELGLLAYLNFARNELQSSNLQQLRPTGISLKRYRDKTTGEWTTQRDTLVGAEVVGRLADAGNYAPMRGLATMENIKYSYVAKDNELYITLDVPDYAVEKTNVMVTVKDVADLNGNLLASPVTMDIYVYRNPLRWGDKQIELNVGYGWETDFKTVVKNISGKSRHFAIEGLPVWITASQYSGVVEALGEVPITFTVSPYINVGDFDEVIYLVGEDDMTEPIPIHIKVRGEAPDWAVDEDLIHSNISMHIIGQVVIHGEVAHSSEDMLAAFDENHRLLGVCHLAADPTGRDNSGLAYLTVYNNNYAEIPLFFEFYDASTGIIHKMLPGGPDLNFKNNTVVGSTTEPVVFEANNGVVQAVYLKRGWNWVSFNVCPPDAPIKQLLNNATNWQVGDGLEADKADGGHYVITYKAIRNPKDVNSLLYLWDYGDSIVTLDPTLMYRFYSNDEKTAYVYGFSTLVPVTVHQGWNRIGYISTLNLPLGTALAEYTDKGSEGDIIKSQSEFAVLTVDAMGNKMWKGTLNYLRVGEGYMLKRNAATEVSFYYPTYFSSSRYGGKKGKQAQPLYENVSGTSMTVVAVADGVEVEAGDRLVAYRDGAVCGIAEADEEGVFYLNVGDAEQDATTTSTKRQAELTFTLERDDELLAMATRRQIAFKAHAALGTPEQPTAISFTTADECTGEGWYTVSGIKLAKSPVQRGVYIKDGQKVVIK